MKAKLCSFLLLLPLCGTLAAQSLVEDLSGSTAIVVRDPARQASTETDAAIYNPAGTALMPDGLHLTLGGVASISSINATTSSQTFRIKDNYVLPSAQLVFKKGKWAISGSFASEGGVFKREYKDGSPYASVVMDALNGSLLSEINEVLQTTALAAQLGTSLGQLRETGMSLDDEMRISQNACAHHLYNWAIRVGAAYQINEHFSAYAGLKVSKVSIKTGVSAYPVIYNTETGMTTAADQYFANAKQAIQGSENTELVDNFNKLYDNFNNVGEIASDINESYFNYSKSGWGVAPVLGLDYKTGDFNFGLKYEFSTHIRTNGGGCIATPSILSAGGNWQATDWLNVAVGGDVYFKSGCKALIPADNQVCGNFSANATFKLCDALQANIGYLCGKTSDDIYILEMAKFNPSVSSSSLRAYNRVSAGLRYAATSKLSFDLGVSVQNKYTSPLTYTLVTDGEASTPANVQYKIKAPVQVALGINYSF